MNANNTDLSQEKIKIIRDAVTTIISALGEDETRVGLVNTGSRVAKTLLDLTAGFHMTPADAIGDAIFPCDAEGMVVQKNIDFFSLCEHHLLPFFGKVHLAYLPNKKIIGLSKIGRIVDIYAKRLQVQENLTHQIALALEKNLHPKGVAVMIEADHFCMKMRGVKKQNSIAITTEYTGSFKNDQFLRADFLASIKK